MNLVDRLQDSLQELYDVAVRERASDFLIKDPVLLDRLAPPEGLSGAREKLLLYQEENTLELGLYIDDSVLRCLEEQDPFDRLHVGNLPAWCLAIEGVSHFLYVCWNAASDRPVTLLELELQAEVDRYMMLVTHFLRSNLNATRGCYGFLFQRPRFRNDLQAHEYPRYWSAHRHAARYCAYLQRLILGRFSGLRVTNHLRRFYRLQHHGKIRHIATSL